MMNRRSLLEKFGVGALIVPIVGGAVDQSATAQLIEVPKVKAVEIFTEIPKPVSLREVRSARVVLEMEDNSTRVIEMTDGVYGSGLLTIGEQRECFANLTFTRAGLSMSPATVKARGAILGSWKII